MLFSTSYFGEIPYYQAIAKQGIVEIDLYERYKKQSWRNRTQILESNGPMYLSVPVIRPNGSKSIVKDIQIANNYSWQKDHWKAIESSYKHAPYFFYYGDQIKKLIYQEEELLYKFNHTLFLQLLNWLDITISSVKFSESYISPTDKSDFRVSLAIKQFNLSQKQYIQVFSDKYPFYPNLSVLDLLMNQGPFSRNFILR